MGIFSSDKEKAVTAGFGSDTDQPVPAYATDSHGDVQEGIIHDNSDALQRHLANRQIQLIAIGGSIGTALFVSIGTGLYNGGPGNLLLAFAIQSIFLALVNNCLAEMSTAYPVSGGFIRLAGHWVDDALGFMVGWNFFFYEALLIPFEISAFGLVASYWSERLTDPGPIAGIITGIIICYAGLNILAVKAYGESEFWLSGGKVILIFMLFLFTFITMVGGNPAGDAYGFRYWEDGRAFREYIGTGDIGRLQGFLATLATALFTVVGPEYISIVAAEAVRPRIYIKAAFKMVYVRYALFFIGGALAVGIICPSRDPTLTQVVTGGGAHGAAASPYVIAMQNLGISVLPDIVNALLLTSIFSAGNTYTYCATRNLYGLALSGSAPHFLTKCTRNGVPIYCFLVVLIFPLLSFLQVGSGSAVVIGWFASLVTGGGLINYIVMCITYIRFHAACKAQGLDRNNLPYKGYLQPFCAWAALIWLIIVTAIYGYTCYIPTFDVSSFFANYTMQLFIPWLYLIWKVIHKTKIKKAHEIDLVWDKPLIDAYEDSFTTPPSGFWKEVLQLVGIGRVKGGNNQRRRVSVADVESRK